MPKEERERKTIDGEWLGSRHCIGYCEYSGHPGYLTDRMAREHHCHKKNCRYYKPLVKQDRKKGKENWRSRR